jgi:apolipoprotein N-acyltransferase
MAAHSPMTQPFEALAHRILLLEGPARHGLAVFSGALAAMALPPIEALPVLGVSFPLLVWLLDGAGGSLRSSFWTSLVKAFSLGWWFGFGFFLAGLWWLGAAFVIGGEQFIWLLPLGVIGLPAVLALFMGLGVVITRLFWSQSSLRIFALAFGLGCSEWLRGWVLTGFPWNGFGQAFSGYILPVQSVSVIGTDALGVLTVLIFAAPATLATGTRPIARWAMPVFASLLLVAMTGFGWVRLSLAGGVTVDLATLPMAPNVRIRIMQPNLTQAERLALPTGTEILARYFALSDRATSPESAGINDVTHLIWPESPFPFVLDRNAQALAEIKAFLPEKTTLITGSVRSEPRDAQNGGTIFYNAMQVMTKKDGITQSYDKTHLVPFGEYLPLDPVLRALGITQFVSEIGGFTPGLERRTIDLEGFGPMIPLICFESIFSSEVHDRSMGAKVIVNVTNDAWFGATFGPYQHLAQARLRGIEFGYSLIRAANSGVSVVADPYGRIIAHLALDQAGVLDSPLPLGLSTTVYRQSGGFSFAAVMVCFFLTSVLGFLTIFRRG